ncbi:MAG TPA: hypothetical protein P5107_11775 [Thermotogota bacterium]|nr:hypothetical protein [Thermotogota bacterium]
MKYFRLTSGLSPVLNFSEPVFYAMTIGKDTFDFSQFYDVLTEDNFYKLKHFLSTKETSAILYLELDLTDEITMKIEVLETGYLATFDYEDKHYEFQVDGAFFRDYLLMIQTIVGYMKEHTRFAYKSNYDEICNLLKKVYNE